ncbi:MAG: DUF6318 family protein [Demequina sp.]|nr:DUF6318 family protein [Demequina sp.]
MDKWREVTRRLLACFLGAAVLAACTPGGGAVVTETPSATASGSVTATASPSPSPSAGVDVLAQLPEDAKSPGLDGAIATAEFFVELYGTMLQTGDTRLWDALSGPDCAFCDDGSSTARGYLDAGTEVTGGRMSVDRARTHANLADDGFTYVGVVAHQDEIRTADPTSTPVVVATPSDAGLILQLEYVGDRWRVNGVQVVGTGEI